MQQGSRILVLRRLLSHPLARGFTGSISNSLQMTSHRFAVQSMATLLNAEAMCAVEYYAAIEKKRKKRRERESANLH